jgi:hypothetical protein
MQQKTSLTNLYINANILIVSGSILLSVILGTQYVSMIAMTSENQMNLSLERIKLLNDIALPTFVVISFSLFLILAGIRIAFKWWIISKLTLSKDAKPNTKISRIKRIISLSLQQSRSKKIFWLSTISYLFLFLFLSNTIIYRPYASLSLIYDVKTPSFFIIGCCGMPASFPLLIMYLTDHLGLMLIPYNIIIAPFLSILVGLNICVSFYKLQNNNNNDNCTKKYLLHHTRRRGVGFLSNFVAASSGLFSSCPACAGNVIFSLLGIGGSTALIQSSSPVQMITTTNTAINTHLIMTTVGFYQPLIFLVSSIMLLIVPIIISKR